jgi:hypothetical protein
MLTKIARERQRETPDETFPLSTHALSRVLGLGKNGFVKVSRDIKFLKSLNPPLLKLEKQGGRFKGKPGRSSRFRYVGTR